MIFELRTVIATIIFAFVSVNFLFPCNAFIPLDRRTTAVLGSVICYLTNRYLFVSVHMDMLNAVDFDVMILLSSIMIINHILVHLKETKELISYLQNIVQNDPNCGFWMVSSLALLASPFLTNDGVCLLLVEPVLQAFEHAPTFESVLTAHTSGRPIDTSNSLNKEDAVYFLLALACSANIGSALTYTGNPQNMIVSSDSLSVMPSYKFFVYMTPATLLSWLITTEWIRRCWINSKTEALAELQSIAHRNVNTHEDGRGPLQLQSNESTDNHNQIPSCWNLRIFGGGGISKRKSTAYAPLSPRRKKAIERSRMATRLVRLILSPVPYVVLVLLVVMIVMIFVDLMPISGLICCTAIVMIITIVLGNHWRNRQVWIEEEHNPMERDESAIEMGDNAAGSYSRVDSDEDLGPMLPEDRLDNLNSFFEALFNSIDYSLLIIFLGLFIVVANIDSTGLPKMLWDHIVGQKPFQTLSSIIGISVFVLFTSQLLGNVAVIQLAKPNIEVLSDEQRRLAWAVLSFVSTVGGNLTITGSAANIIVAERAARLDSSTAITFFNHFKTCFWITLFSCAMGAFIIITIVEVDNTNKSAW